MSKILLIAICALGMVSCGNVNIDDAPSTYAWHEKPVHVKFIGCDFECDGYVLREEDGYAVKCKDNTLIHQVSNFIILDR